MLKSWRCLKLSLITSGNLFVSSKEITLEKITREISQKDRRIKGSECYQEDSVLRIRECQPCQLLSKSGKIGTEEYPLDSQQSGPWFLCR